MMLSLLRPTSVDELATMLRDSGTGLRIRGAGTRMDAGREVSASTQLQLGAFSGVRAYTPGDLTISVGAATTLAELSAVTAAQGQWCPLFPWGDDRGTVGATIATATSGPFAESLGRPRDLVLGLECVDGRGRVIRAGGRVVKNVAGFDLTRLVTGSWGTLAVITELHLRLRARPAVDRSIYIEGAPDEALREFARGRFAPLAALQVGANLSRQMGRDGTAGWLLRLAGNAEYVNAAAKQLLSLGRCEEQPDSVWDLVRREMAVPERASQWQWSPLAVRVKRAFDPRNVLNPGLLGAHP
jgi:glycolate oxidase FAD binding subunit